MAEPTTSHGSSGRNELAAPPRRRARLRVIAATLLVLLLALVIAVPVGLLIGLRSEAGSAWLLEQVPGLKITGARGSLLGDFAAERLELMLPDGGHLVLEQPAWKGLDVGRSPLAGHWVDVRIDRLQARRAEFIPGTPKTPSEPLQAPTDLKLPLTLHIGELALGEFATPALGDKPLRDLRASVDLGAERGSQHRIELANLEWDRLAASGTLQIGADAPLPLRTRLALRPSAAASAAVPASAPAAAAAASAASPFEQWSASASLDGPLAKPTLQASASAGGRRLLDADAVLRPFEPWPLATLQARTSELDLSAFVGGAPLTSLSGKADIASSGVDQPAKAEIAIDNAAAGPWNAGKLPLRSLRLELQARPDAPQVATVRRFNAALGSADRPPATSAAKAASTTANGR